MKKLTKSDIIWDLIGLGIMTMGFGSYMNSSLLTFAVWYCGYRIGKRYWTLWKESNEKATIQ